LVQVEYEVANNSDHAIVGQAVPSYGPARAAAFFKKIECFCFTPQTLAAGERRTMPVLFVLDPAMDREVQTVTLSYTFFNTDRKAQSTGALQPAEEATPNG
jgi:cytochrome c oxidase assembly protein subunit 11